MGVQWGWSFTIIRLKVISLLVVRRKLSSYTKTGRFKTDPFENNVLYCLFLKRF
jgi:hypothetical protein